MRCPICGATVNIRLIAGDDPDSAEAIERREAWALAEDDSLLREAKRGEQ
jgi:hypothetical protein